MQTKGRKKTALARLRLKPGTGRVRVNGTLLDAFTPHLAAEVVREPLLVAEQALGKEFSDGLDIDLHAYGGGIMAQAYACRTAIGKALLEYTGSDDLRKLFSEYDRSLFIDDVRIKEPKKCLRLGARAKPTKSYR
ncbi:30S ribosomal protein S9 [Candidatus Micrarchaeota archaeon]|nr:30S ribosomal protein S9 [Candidatus Micrarchaeota archaeon]